VHEDDGSPGPSPPILRPRKVIERDERLREDHPQRLARDLADRQAHRARLDVARITAYEMAT